MKDELTIKDIRCDFGPYYLGDISKSNSEPKVENFINLVKIYGDENSPKGKLREWIKELGINDKLAQSMLDRINDMLENKGEFDKALNNLYSRLKCENLILEKDGAKKTPIYDVLQILSVTSNAGDK